MLDSDLKNVVVDAFNNAWNEFRNEQYGKIENRKRSGALVRCLAGEFRKKYNSNEYSVFSIDTPSDEFERNEYLYDVHVCRIAKTKDKKLSYLAAAEWQVESELENDTKEALIDFSKLVVGAARHKLFVGPLVSDSDNGKHYKNCLVEVANVCSGSVYLAEVPRPSQWNKKHEVEVYKFCAGKWCPIES